ncbi:MAG: putative metal-binding motif-containing protein [Myxococcota bacterium]|nr:putative metal-binding motif-containing protein [Myxococcota bacterium]
MYRRIIIALFLVSFVGVVSSLWASSGGYFPMPAGISMFNADFPNQLKVEEIRLSESSVSDSLAQVSLAPETDVIVIHALRDSGVLCEGVLMSEVCGGELLPLTNLCGRESADCLEQSGVREASKLVLDEYGDNFDFLVMFTNFPQRSECGGNGYYCGVQNDTFGIGKRQFNIQDLYGSEGRLQGVINLFDVEAWETFDLKLHENPDIYPLMGRLLGERWLGSFTTDPNDSQSLLCRSSAGWSGRLHSGGSLMGGRNWVLTYGQQERVSSEELWGEWHYSDLDLYAMGLKESFEIGPIQYLSDAGFAELSADEQRELNQCHMSLATEISISDDRFEEIELGDFVAQLGERLPRAGSIANRTIKIGFVLISDGRFSDAYDHEVATRVQSFGIEWKKKFSEYTSGLGAIQTHVDPVGVLLTHAGTHQPQSKETASAQPANNAAAASGPGVCDPQNPTDFDNDTFDCRTDCDDSDLTIYPGAPEVCNGKDDNCDGAKDNGLNVAQNRPLADKQQGECNGVYKVCDGVNGWANPDYTLLGGISYAVDEIGDMPCDGKDNDCDGLTDEHYPELGTRCDSEDSDHCENGIWACTEQLGKYCDENENFEELCDGIDNDCNVSTREEVIFDLNQVCSVYPNSPCVATGITVCHSDKTKSVCNALSVAEEKLALYGANPEECNNLDDNCNGIIDEDPLDDNPTLGLAYEFTKDAKSYGLCSLEVTGEDSGVCKGVYKYCVNGELLQCDESLLRGSPNHPKFVPGKELLCDTLDEDCDGDVDEMDDLALTPEFSTACDSGADLDSCARGNYDCQSGEPVCINDIAATAEICNSLDDDCDGLTDTDDPDIVIVDADKQDGVCANQKKVCDNGALVEPNYTLVAGYNIDEICDGLDNDCDGLVDECLNESGEEKDYSVEGALVACSEIRKPFPATKSQGVCSEQKQICQGAFGWIDPSTALVENYQAQETLCDGLDNDCDGDVDNIATSNRPFVTNNTGACLGQRKSCVNLGGGVYNWENVYSSIPAYSLNESCNGIDDNCDGLVDNQIPEASTPFAAMQDGVCATVRQTCDGSNGWKDPTNYGVDYEEIEVSCDGLDNDCDGVVDDPFVFPSGAPMTDALNGTTDLYKEMGCGSGLCAGGSVVCAANKISLECDSHGLIRSEKIPKSCDGVDDCDICDSVDDDCDGAVSDGLYEPLTDDEKAAIPAEMRNGVCLTVQNTCDGGAWVQLPFSSVLQYEDKEQGCDGLDNDCDGKTDECLVEDVTTEGDGSACPAPGTAQYFERPSSSKSVGVCTGLKKLCRSALGWQDPTFTNTENYELEEITCDGKDNDCNGAVDDIANVSKPQVTLGNSGVCANEKQLCRSSDDGFGNITFDWVDSEVVGYEAIEKTCDGLDNDCNGLIDEIAEADRPLVSTPFGVCLTNSYRQECANGQWRDPAWIGTAKHTGGYEHQEETCDNLDNDCDGSVDVIAEGFRPHADKSAGVCSVLRKSCVDAEGGAVWVNPNYTDIPTYEVEETLCDGLDNDCDGLVDNLTQDSTTFPDADKKVGVCLNVKKDCGSLPNGDKAWVEPDYVVTVPNYESPEVSCDELDNDCDGIVDNIVKVNRPDAATSGVCVGQKMICNTALKAWEEPDYPLSIATYQASETLCDGLDNNCDGVVDNLSQPTSEHPLATKNIGVCADVRKICGTNALGQKDWVDPDYGVTVQTYEASEKSCDNVDNDCDGVVDNIITGNRPDAVTSGVCVGQKMECNSGASRWDEPNYSLAIPTYQAAETLCDGLDNNCDGVVDNLSQTVDQHPLATRNIGVCAGVRKICGTDEHGDKNWIDPDYGVTVPNYESSEKSCDNLDNDCDGVVDNIITGNRPSAVTSGVCAGQKMECNSDESRWDEPNYALAITSYQAAETLCDGLDNNCDGVIDNLSQDVGLYPAATKSSGVCAGVKKICGLDSGTKAWIDPDYGVTVVNFELEEKSCDGLDNDCDGVVDNIVHDNRPDAATSGVCNGQKMVCNTAGKVWEEPNYALTVVSYQAAETLCDGLDNNCDGMIDNLSQVADLYPTAAKNIGVCVGTKKACGTNASGNKAWIEPDYGTNVANFEASEMSCDGLDNDCDGVVDNIVSQNRPDAANSGVCTGQKMVCNSGETRWEEPNYALAIATYEASETLCDGLDNNCDGMIDNLSQVVDLYPVATKSVGVCVGAKKVCGTNDAGVKTWVDPDFGTFVEKFEESEMSCDGLDNDCDGAIDNIIAANRPLAANSGVCAGQKLVCNSAETKWIEPDYSISVASYQVSETLCDDLDNDCDGVVDNLSQAVELYPAATKNVGVCADAKKVCGTDENGKKTWVNPDYGVTVINFESPELSCDGLDNDCDGVIDNIMTQNRPDVAASGVCVGQKMVCNTALKTWEEPNYGLIISSYESSETLCDGLDNNCDGVVDNLSQSKELYPLATKISGLCANVRKICATDENGIKTWVDPDYSESVANYEVSETYCDGMDNDCDGVVDNLLQLPNQYPLASKTSGVCGDIRKLCGTNENGDKTWIEPDYALEVATYEESDLSCDGLDNDCDGVVDNIALQNRPQVSSSGVCVGQKMVCNSGLTAWVEPDYSVLIGDYEDSETLCDGLDNNCDGVVDNLSQTPDSYPQATKKVGVCADVRKVCGTDVHGSKTWIDPDYGDSVFNYEVAETICDGLDNDCNGIVDDIGKDNRPTVASGGVCVGKKMICNSLLKTWEEPDYALAIATYEASETLCDGLDNNCDGVVDNLSQSTDDYPQGTKKVGVCADVKRVCSTDENGTKTWVDPDYGDVVLNYEIEETICDGLDNNCDGLVDNIAKANRPEVSAGGVCVGQKMVCNSVAKAWEEPDYGLAILTYEASETLCDGLDNNCDGLVDNLSQAADAYPAATKKVGVCSVVKRICGTDETGKKAWLDPDYGDAVVNYEVVESICDGLDNDCDGLVDNIIKANRPDVVGGGVCVGQKMVCNSENKAWEEPDYSLAIPSYEAAETLCDGLDNNCDGVVDNLSQEAGAYPAATKKVGVCADVKRICGEAENGTKVWLDPVYGDVISNYEEVESICDGLDNDCDGVADNMIQANRPLVTAGGVCVGQRMVCNSASKAWEEPDYSLSISTYEESETLCDGLDNNCDGVVDNLSQAGDAYPQATKRVGVCATVRRVCGTDESGEKDWLDPVYGDVVVGYQEEETLCDGLDNDCDGTVDDIIKADRPDVTAGGVCTGQKMACNSVTKAWEEPDYSLAIGTYEAAETLCDGLDNNCDGVVDNLSQDQDAYPAATKKVGVCAGVKRLCGTDDNGLKAWLDPVYGDVVLNYEEVETLCDGLDNDCDGIVDNIANNNRPVVSAGGVCVGQRMVCDSDSKSWEEPDYSLSIGSYEASETLCDGLDNNCDGVVDNLSQAVDGYPQATKRVGVCADVKKICGTGDNGLKAWLDPVYGDVVVGYEEVETICDGLDNDCDGAVDTILKANRPVVSAGGVCAGQRMVCDSDSKSWEEPDYSLSIGSYEASETLCDGLDNNCDGVVDNLSQTVDTYPLATKKVGVCAGVKRVCGTGDTGLKVWLDPNYEDAVPNYEPIETICDGLDNDCDGTADNILRGNRPDVSVGGVCVGQKMVCNSALKTWEEPDYAVAIPSYETDETLCDGLDNNCDGLVDNLSQDADSYPQAIKNAGVCSEVRKVCGEDGEGNKTWVEPDYADVILDFESSETVCDGLDNDCDGGVDNIIKANRPVVAVGGVCVGQKMVCNLNQKTWEEPNYAVAITTYQGTETLCDGLDNDCDGLVDNILKADRPDAVSTGVCVGQKMVCDSEQKAWVEPDYSLTIASYQSAETKCDGLDNNCDGLVDNLSQPTDEHPQAIRASGVCSGLKKVCGFGEDGLKTWIEPDYALTVINYEATETSCDGLDNDCDGVVDNIINENRPETITSGVCAGRKMSCNSGLKAWEEPDYAAAVSTYEAAETLCDGLDNDCDGVVDNLSQVASLYPSATKKIGVCMDAKKVCAANENGEKVWSEPDYSVTVVNFEASEMSCDGLDNDCDGVVDNIVSVNRPDAVTSGVCVGQKMDCNTQETRWEEPNYALAIATYQASETLCDGLDNDCDGVVDNLQQAPTLYPSAKMVVGVCADVKKVCGTNLDGVKTWVEPDYGVTVVDYEVSESSCDGLDNDCDGVVDNILSESRPDAATSGVCGGQKMVCNSEEKAWEEPDYALAIASYQASETLCDGLDNNCDGVIDNLSQGVEQHPMATKATGVCASAKKICGTDSDGIKTWIDPTYNVTVDGYEMPETSCDGLDNDCDGMIDNILVEHRPNAAASGVCSGQKMECDSALKKWNEPDYTLAIQTYEPQETLCDGLDNNCDGLIDNLSQDKLLYPNAIKNVGVCAGAKRVCGLDDDGTKTWIEPDYLASLANYEVVEVSCDGLDNDCDGDIDEIALDSRPDALGVGVCAGQKRVCDSVSKTWITPNYVALVAGYEEIEISCDGLDNDCDGIVDNLALNSEQRPLAAMQYGVCHDQRKYCDNVSGTWKEPDYTVLPDYEETETLCDELDNDCNGVVDDPYISAAEFGTETCLTEDCVGTFTDSNGDSGLTKGMSCGVGLCGGGRVICGEDQRTLLCDSHKNALPELEPKSCDGVADCDKCDGVDDDCDGVYDEGLVQQKPEPGLRSGVCKNQLQSCNAGTWEDLPVDNISGYEVSERTCDGEDNDCDGEIDESSVAVTAAAGDRAAGVCITAKQVCENGNWLEPDYTAFPNYEPNESLCDGLDNDCDGDTDEDLIGPEADNSKGVCNGAKKVCETRDGITMWREPTYLNHTVSFEVLEISCDGVDNDCDGVIDNIDEYLLVLGTNQKGTCLNSKKVCRNGVYQEPTLATIADYEFAEVSCDGLDNDCDGVVDNITDLPLSTQQLGVCKGVRKECGSDGGSGWQWNEPVYAPAVYNMFDLVYQETETLCDGLDNDCNGTVDDPPKLAPYRPLSSKQDGVCEGQRQYCGLDEVGNYTWVEPDYFITVSDNVFEITETRCDGLDNDCDGTADNLASTEDAPAGSKTLGVCAARATKICAGINQWQDPNYLEIDNYEIRETLCDGVDNDCDGLVDECLAGSGTFHDRPPGDSVSTIDCPISGEAGYVDTPFATKQSGQCLGQRQVCRGVSGWMDPDYLATVVAYEADETTCDGLDNDCDDVVDEDLDKPLAQNQKGVCQNSRKYCAGDNRWQEPNLLSIELYEPVETLCDGLDNDCDGQVDEDLEDFRPNASFQDGICVGQKKLCGALGNGQGTGWIDPDYNFIRDEDGEMIYESVETICDGLDNDCDGSTDEGIDLSAPKAEKTVGVCSVMSKKRCGDSGDGVKNWIEPNYYTLPDYEDSETLCDGLDNDCDGSADEASDLVNHSPMNDLNVGVCAGHRKVCGVDEEGNPIWVNPNYKLIKDVNGNFLYEEEEISCDGLDNDCDGTTDNIALDKRPDANTVGVCKTQKMECDSIQKIWIAPDFEDIANYEPQEVTCDGLDNDCDGRVDESEHLLAPRASLQEGVCSGARKVCIENSFGQITWMEPPYAVLFATYELNEQSCDGLDNDCDGAPDHNLVAPMVTKNFGVCFGERQICNGQEGWVDPSYSGLYKYEVEELSCDGLDNDCDGQIDEELPRPPAENQVGVCRGAFKVCGRGPDSDEVAWREPTFLDVNGYQVNELTCDNLDNDCDGSVDEGFSDISCGFGRCRVTIDSCVNGRETPQEACAPKEGSVEVCDGIDNDCDESIDEDPDNSTVALSEQCYTGPEGTKGQGICRGGSRICVRAGEVDEVVVGGVSNVGAWGVCVGEVLPGIEVCDGIDNNCDGLVDEYCGGVSGGGFGCQSIGDSESLLPLWILLLLGGLVRMRVVFLKGRHWLSIVLVATMVATFNPNVVQASAPSMDIELAPISPHAYDNMAIMRPMVLTHLNYQLGIHSTMTWNNLRFRTGQNNTTDSVLKRRNRSDLQFSLGLYDMFEVAIGLPVILHNYGNTESTSGLVMNELGLGDLTLSAKGHLANVCYWPFDFAVSAGLSLPTGKSEGLYGSSHATFFMRAVAEKELYVRSKAFLHSVSVLGEVGFLFRASEEVLYELRVNHDITYNTALLFRFNRPNFDLGLGWVGMSPLDNIDQSGSRNQAELLSFIRWELNKETFLSFGLGSGIMTGYETSEFRASIGLRFVPGYKPSDHDDDGVPDKYDSCPCDWNLQ